MNGAALAQWLHLGAAVVAVGGVLYVRAVLGPSLRVLPAEERAQVLRAAGRRFHPILWGAIAVLLVTGLYNVVVAADAQAANPIYWRLLGIKILLAVALFGLALAVTLPVTAFAWLARRRPEVLLVNLVLAAAILYLSALLRRL